MLLSEHGVGVVRRQPRPQSVAGYRSRRLGISPGRKRDDPHAWLLTVTVLTTDELWRIRDRAPLIVPAEAYRTWLGNADELRQPLRTAPGLIAASISLPRCLRTSRWRTEQSAMMVR